MLVVRIVTETKRVNMIPRGLDTKIRSHFIDLSMPGSTFFPKAMFKLTSAYTVDFYGRTPTIKLSIPIGSGPKIVKGSNNV